MENQTNDQEIKESAAAGAFMFLVILVIVFSMGFLTAKSDSFEDFYLVDYIPYKKVELPEVGKCYRKLGSDAVFKVELIYKDYMEYRVAFQDSKINFKNGHMMLAKVREFANNDNLMPVDCSIIKEK